MEDLPCPVVFAAHALCLTAAFELALACDLLLAAESARFGLVEIVVGLTPSMGGPQRLAERAGPARARELVMTGELYDAATLERWNVVNRVLPDADFDAAATQRLRGGSPAGRRWPTRPPSAWSGSSATPARAPPTRSSRRWAARCSAREDLRNAVASFLEDGPGKATYEGR